jgi:muramoyltetrapeptide carboxypeptidase
MIDRRDFGRLLAAGIAAGMGDLGAAGAEAPAARGAAGNRQAAPPRPLLKPRRLAPGDTVGMVLPASMAFEASTLDLGREQLEALGFRVKLGAHVRGRHGYFAGTDRERAADLLELFADDSVQGIFCYSGGWGSPRLLPLLDFEVIRRHPKVFIGFSDITALVNAIHQETGLVTFHGPMAVSNLRPWTVEHLRRAVQSAAPLGTLGNPPKEENELVNRNFRTLALRGGRARGPLAGGNLTLLATLMGTPWEVATAGTILLLEDTDEELYRIDRMLTQLALGGKLDGVAGVVFGTCTDCPVEGPSFSLEEILRERLEPLGVPVLKGLAFGHILEKLTLPIGLPATLDADAGTLTFDEAAVV